MNTSESKNHEEKKGMRFCGTDSRIPFYHNFAKAKAKLPLTKWDKNSSAHTSVPEEFMVENGSHHLQSH